MLRASDFFCILARGEALHSADDRTRPHGCSENPISVHTMASNTTGLTKARAALRASGFVLFGLVSASCSGGGGGTTGDAGVGTPSSTNQVSSVEYGRLADIYGIRTTSDGQSVELFQKDVLIGREIRDERIAGTASEGKTDSEVRYDFLSSDPDTLQPRVFIPREIGSAAFDQLFSDLDRDVSLVTPLLVGQGGPGQPYTVVPRNAAVRLNFTRPVGVTDDFFVIRDANGQVTGLRNTEAVQLLQVAGDPSQPGNFVPLPVRIVVKERSLLLDPVLLGSEGLQYQTRNNAAGLPPSPDNVGANIRVALALEGPLAIPGLRSDGYSGINNSGRPAIVRDFRSGNSGDSSPNLARGFVLDTEPPRLVGELSTYLERVDRVSSGTMRIRVYKAGISHEIDRGDVFRFLVEGNSVPFGVTEVVADPEDDAGQPAVQHVDVLVRFVPGLEALDPSNRPDFPQDPAQLDAWLRNNAPRALLVTEYQGGRIDANTGAVLRAGDDPRYFGLFTPTPLPQFDGTPSQPNENISPFAGAVIRFTKPVDFQGTVKSADTFYFATRDLVDQVQIDQFISTRPWRVADATGAPAGVGMAPSSFNLAKFRTPHLVGSRALDEDGSQTTLRLQPLQGFFLDQAMRQDGPRPYYLHVIAGDEGIRDLAGNPIDLQTNDPNRARGLVIPFTLDTRSAAGRPQFEDNLAVSVVRTMANSDEDPNPSYYLPEEVQGNGAVPNARATPLADVFGAFSRVDGRLEGRPTTRLRRIADDLNQAPVDPQASVLRWCPEQAAGEQQISSNSATAPLGQGLQNPFNPYGCRLQTVWREIDLSLSRTDPFDFNLDIEQMYWAPYTGAPIEFDEFDKVTLRLGHSERRPEPCVGNFGALPTFPDSGLVTTFEDNYVRNLRAGTSTAQVDTRPAPHNAFANTPSNMRIDAQQVVLEPNQRNRFLPLPTFRRPYFVYRDETMVEQGGACGIGSDVNNTAISFLPWIISPWNHGVARRAVQDNGTTGPIAFLNGFWHSGNNYFIRVDTTQDRSTEGLLGNIALPLLADFFVECDSSQLPAGNGYVAFGLTGWQTSIALTSSNTPNFRMYSAGRPPFPNLSPICREPFASPNGQGGYAPPPPLGVGGTTIPGDNTFYWVMIDFLKRASVITNGFLDIYNPHRVPNGFADSRLGPYYTNPQNGSIAVPSGIRPRFLYEFDPPSTALPGGTSVVAQFRAAGQVDSDPWYWREWAQGTGQTVYPAAYTAQLQTNATNFPLDPFKACDAHIRKFDDRQSAGVARNWWTYFYNRTVTTYVLDPNQLFESSYLSQFNGPNEGFTPTDVRYVNWRYLMSNNIDATPPVAPTIDTFVLSYRFQRGQ